MAQTGTLELFEVAEDLLEVDAGGLDVLVAIDIIVVVPLCYLEVPTALQGFKQFGFSEEG